MTPKQEAIAIFQEMAREGAYNKRNSAIAAIGFSRASQLGYCHYCPACEVATQQSNHEGKRDCRKCPIWGGPSTVDTHCEKYDTSWRKWLHYSNTKIEKKIASNAMVKLIEEKWEE